MPSTERLLFYGNVIRMNALRPLMWPHIYELAARKARRAARGVAVASSDEVAAYYADLHVTNAEALEALGLTSGLPSLRDDHHETFEWAEEQVAASPFQMGGAGALDLIHAVVESLDARYVVETGVAYGWSSLAILLSLKNRPGSVLHSIDLPYITTRNEAWVGVVVPEELREHWVLHRGSDRWWLPRVLKQLPHIDVAHYDSDKGVEGRRFAYPLLWEALRPGGVLISDDIVDNFGFRDFAEGIAQQTTITSVDGKFVGLLRKPL